jgi:4Fe-4S binding domain
VAQGAVASVPDIPFAGKLCIEVTPSSKVAEISEELCIGCGICVKVCCCARRNMHESHCVSANYVLSVLVCRSRKDSNHASLQLPPGGHSEAKTDCVASNAEMPL